MISQQRSLAELDAGEQAQIQMVLFDSLRSKFGAAGLIEGIALKCVSRDSGKLTLVMPSGDQIDISREHARFVEVSTPARLSAPERRP